MHSSPSLLHTEFAQDQFGPVHWQHIQPWIQTSMSITTTCLTATMKNYDSRLYCSNQKPSTLRHTILLMMNSNARIHDNPDLQRLQTLMWSPWYTPGKPGSFHVHLFWSLMYWQHVWILPAHKVSHTLGLPIISGKTTVGSQWTLCSLQSKHYSGPTIDKQNICVPHSQILKSGNPELVEAYHEAMHQD